MCRTGSVCSQTSHSPCSSKVKGKPDQFGAMLQLPVEKPVMMAREFCGEWTNSNGDDVEVFFDEIHRAQLRATLVSKNGHKKLFLVDFCNFEWWCGSAFLVKASASKDQLHWEFERGSVSIWYRSTAINFPRQAMVVPLAQADDSLEGCQSPREDRCTAIHLPRQAMVSEFLSQADESLEYSLSGCQSPSEAYFNPGKPYFGFFLPSEESLTGNVWRLSREKEGCRKVQDALSEGDNYSRAEIAKELRGHAWKAAEHSHANYVLQKCIKVMPAEASSFIVDELKTWNGAPAAAYLAKSKTGVRVFQRLLEHCPEQVEGMVNELLDDVRNLSMDQFGNYMMQHILEYGFLHQRRALATSLLGCLDKYDKKICSNECGVAVIGKALEHAPEEERQAIAEALLQDKDRFIRLAMQRHGKVAIATILLGPEKRKARELLVEHAEQLTSRHSKQVLKLVSDGDAGVCQ